MERFVVSARKYRPNTFDTVVGQSAITTTLKNAIRSNHLAQAFLFYGPRGVGKTTCARILAKTINCSNISNITEACNECDSCKTFNSSQSLNIYELDAASNNSVDDIRSLVEQVRFAPHSGKYKVYIIDEVHMLSQSAFNAFLKTLEEPPPYAIFILATTEKHKILPTILSRCQIFNFNRIRIEDIAKHLAVIAEKENIVAEPEGLHIIAQKADGALRDALSMFDQIVSYSDNKITYKIVIENLNVLDFDYYFKITGDILQGNISSSLLLFNEILNLGFDGHNFINGLSAHFRDLLISKDQITLKLLEVSEATKVRYKEQALACNNTFLLNALEIANQCDLQYKMAKNQQLHIELGIIKMCSLNENRKAITEEQKKKVTDSNKPPFFEQKHIDIPNKNTSVNTKVSPVTVKDEAQLNPNIELKEIKEKEEATSVKTSAKTFSISEAFKKQESAAVQISNNNSKDAFDITNLIKVWNTYTEKLLQDGKMNLYSTLSKRKPEIKDNFIIQIVIDNKVQQEELNLEKLNLLGVLRKELNNYSIQLDVVISKTEEDTTAYTALDKFKKMVEKNPQVNELRKQLDLEIDF